MCVYMCVCVCLLTLYIYIYIYIYLQTMIVMLDNNDQYTCALKFQTNCFFFLSAKIIHIHNKKKNGEIARTFRNSQISKPCKLWAQGKCSCETEDCWYFHQDIACLTISFMGDQKSDSSCYFSYATKKQDISKLSKEFSKLKS